MDEVTREMQRRKFTLARAAKQPRKAPKPTSMIERCLEVERLKVTAREATIRELRAELSLAREALAEMYADLGALRDGM